MKLNSATESEYYMSIDTLTREIQKLEDEIADLSRKSAAQSKNESSEEEKIAQIRRSINKNTSP